MLTQEQRLHVTPQLPHPFTPPNPLTVIKVAVFAGVAGRTLAHVVVSPRQHSTGDAVRTGGREAGRGLAAVVTLCGGRQMG